MKLKWCEFRLGISYGFGMKKEKRENIKIETEAQHIYTKCFQNTHQFL